MFEQKNKELPLKILVALTHFLDDKCEKIILEKTERIF